MTPWKERLRQQKILIADGAWGTELAKRGLAPGEAPERWNLDRPDAVREIAESYVNAGADIILTNTFGASPIKLAKAGLDASAEEINRRGAEISRAAAGDETLVFASIGPTGEFMVPVGTLTESELVACFARQARALAQGGANGIVIETFTDLNEAKAALRAVRESTSLPVVVSMTYDKGPKGYATMMGVMPHQAAAELENDGADVVGANCGSGIENIIEIVAALRPATGLPIWAKPNAGLPELIDGKTVFRQSPEHMAARFPDLAKAGAAIIGGCCGSTPDHIRRFVELRNRMK